MILKTSFKERNFPLTEDEKFILLSYPSLDCHVNVMQWVLPCDPSSNVKLSQLCMPISFESEVLTSFSLFVHLF